ncbi:hypothetical protein I2492_04235 [Budviciaceae bacterium CWB-B4]|uniref:Primosomal replication protein PriB/PriC domain protein n=1 Tax=Limnobaculum xujianqingii TaxID=2738837 RepID=A0A9D7FRH6_9GAMM|nr:hypothetical protein [Limnobaculum xujianqingii]MBK5072224.1 hypothetical protein [Limnobaculum xujianqingii]MBK5175533.1 hypothetical protein [Limnobaculum xujianqingii]
MNKVDIESMIQLYVEAEKSVLSGKSITFNGQQMTMENLSEIRSGRKEWERRLSSCNSSTNGRPRYKLARFPR